MTGRKSTPRSIDPRAESRRSVLGLTPLLVLAGVVAVLVLRLIPGLGNSPKRRTDSASSAPLVPAILVSGPAATSPGRPVATTSVVKIDSPSAPGSIIRARSRLLGLGIGPLLVFFGLSLVSGSFSLAGFAQGNSQGDWGAFDCREFHTWPDLPEDEEDYGEYLGKDVADFEAALIPTDPSSDQSFTIAVTGAYPSYGIICEVAFTVGVQGGAEVELGQPQIKPLVGLTCDTPRPTGLQCDEMTVILTAPEPGECVAPGTEHEATLVFHVEQPAKEATNYAFGVEIPAFDCVEDIEDPDEPEEQQEPASPGPQSVAPRVEEVQGVQSTPQPTAEVRSLPSTGSGGFADISTDGTIGLLAILLGIGLAYIGIRNRVA